MLELLFLGTGASVPSRDRMTSCIAVRNGSDIVLMDCGEGSQRQIMVSPFSFMKIRAILITHLHGDHVFGLAPLLQTMSLMGRVEPLLILGPKGIRDHLESIMTVTQGETVYPLEITEVSGGESFKVKDMTISVYRTEHNIDSVGYLVKEKDRPGRLDREKAISLGLKDGPDMSRVKNGETVNGVSPEMVVGPDLIGPSVSYTGDTIRCPSVVEGSMNCTVLVHESTYMSTETDLAREHCHSTAIDAAKDATDCKANTLILTHISNRHDDHSMVVDEAKTIFENTFAAEDMMMFEIRPCSVSVRQIER